MNLAQFVKRVDAAIRACSREELGRFVHDMARSLPEDRRETFLEKLRMPAAEDFSSELLEEKATLSAQLSEIQNRLSQIESGVLRLDSELDNQYENHWYAEEFTFVFHDPDGIGALFNRACLLVHQCVDQEQYHDGWNLVNRLFDMEISVNGDYVEYSGEEPISIWEMASYRLFSYPIQQLLIDSFCAAYQANALEDRPEAVYHIFEQAKRITQPTLEGLFQNSLNEMPQMSEFLDLWIDYLGGRSELRVKDLLEEALRLRNDPARTLEAARKYVEQHPEIYQQLLEQSMGAGTSASLLSIGLEALKTVPVSYVVRSRIALLTATCALRLNDQAIAEQCWFEAFRSHTEPVHYLRLALNSKDFSVWRDAAKQIYQKLFLAVQNAEPHPYDGWQRFRPASNRINHKTYYTLTFLDGDFHTAITDGMNEKLPLGWSSTFMKEGLSLFLLLLYKGENLRQGCQHLCMQLVEQIAFTAQAYAAGLFPPPDMDDISLFWHCFRTWKKGYSLSEEDVNTWLEKLEQWISQRVEAIVLNQHRAQYLECAVFIAALGEVRESRGEVGEKEHILETYRAMYPRHIAFHRELQAVGMKKLRK